MNNNAIDKAIQLFKQKKFSYAKKKLFNILKKNSKDIDALNLLAAIYTETQDFITAKKYYYKALEIEPTNFSTYNNLALLFFKEHDYDKAIEILQDSIQLNKKDPTSLMNLGNCYLEKQNYIKAEEYYKKSIAVGANAVSIYFNMAKLYMNTNQFAYAKEMFETALSIAPKDVDILFEYSLLYLKLKVYKEGFEFYRSRYSENKAEKQSYILEKEKLLKRGTLLRGKRLLLTYEQGFGDIIQFARYIPMYANMGAEVYIKVKKLLHKFLEINFPMVTFLKNNEMIAYDYHSPLMDAAYFFETEYETIPMQNGYLGVNLEESYAIEQKYFSHDTKKRVGIIWRTNSPVDESYKKQQERKSRNIPLKTMLKYLQHTEVSLYSMQVDVTQEERILLEKYNIPSLGDNLVDFYDNALIIDNLDILIAIDTVSTIIAGSMGKEAIVILSGNADWRWTYNDKSTNWFKTISILRKQLTSDWSEPLRELVKLNNTFKPISPLQRILIKAETYHMQNRLAEAKILYEQAISLDNNNYMAYYKLGVVLFELSYIQEAIELISVATKLQPNNSTIYKTLQEIVETLKLTPFEKNYLTFNVLEFNIVKFNIKSTLQPLNQHEIYLLEKLKQQTEKIHYNVLLYDTLQLYIALLENRFSDGLKIFLRSENSTEMELEKLQILYNMHNNLDGFSLQSEDFEVLATIFFDIFNQKSANEEKVQFIPLYFNFYLLERSVSFQSSLKTLSKLFQTYMIDNLQLYSLLSIYDIITFIYWGTTQNIYSLKECDETIIKPLSNKLLSYRIQNKLKPRKEISKYKKKRICYLGHITKYDGAYAVGRSMYSIFKGHYQLNSNTFDFYYYAYNDVNENFLKEIEGFGFTIRRFDNIQTLQQKLDSMKQTFINDEIDIVISEMPWSIPTYLFESRVAPIQIYISQGWPYWSIKELDQMMIPVGQTLKPTKFNKVGKNFFFAVDKKFMYKKVENIILDTERKKYPKNCIILGSLQRLVKITPEYLSTIQTILTTNKNTIAIIAGSGEKKHIKKFINDNNLTNRIFLPGFVDMQLYTKLFDIYLDTFPFPSGHSALEMIAHNKPVVHLYEQMWDGMKKLRINKLVAFTQKEYIHLTNKLITNQDFYTQCVKDSKDLANDFTNLIKMAQEFENNFTSLLFKNR